VNSGKKDGVHYGTVVTSYGTVPEPQLARLF